MQSQTSAGQFHRELEVARAAALDAGEVILRYYDDQSAGVYDKPDGSQVTDADLAADEIIRSHISEAFPSDGILTEESGDNLERLELDRCWIVDPIDGTNQFVARTGQFEVLIALAVKNRPVVAVMFQPVDDLLVSASVGEGAQTTQRGSTIAFGYQRTDPEVTRLMTSTWLGAPENLPLLQRVGRELGCPDVVVSDLGVTVRHFLRDRRAADSLVGVRANGDNTFAWEWDLAVSDLIVHEIGGSLTDLDGQLLQYNKSEPRNVGGIVMSADANTHQKVLDAIASTEAGAGAKD